MPTLSARKKAAILESAIDLFTIKGFAGTSMDAIAAKAGVSKRTVYNHFPSKQDLFETIALGLWQQANQASDVLFDESIEVKDQLITLALNELKLVSDAGFLRLSRVLMAEFIHEQALAQTILARFENEQSNLTIWMEQASKQYRLKLDDAEEAGKHFHSLIKAQAFWPQLMFGQGSIPKEQHKAVAEMVCTMFLSVYGMNH